MQKLTPLLEQKNYEEEDAKLESDDGGFGEDPSEEEINHYDDDEENMDAVDKVMDRTRLPASYYSGHFNTDLLESEKPSLDAACDAYLQGGRFQSEGWRRAWEAYLMETEGPEPKYGVSPVSATGPSTTQSFDSNDHAHESGNKDSGTMNENQSRGFNRITEEDGMENRDSVTILNANRQTSARIGPSVMKASKKDRYAPYATNKQNNRNK